MLSGLGPREHLRQHGIAAAVDLPGVGANLQDHLMWGQVHAVRAGRDTGFTPSRATHALAALCDHVVRSPSACCPHSAQPTHPANTLPAHTRSLAARRCAAAMLCYAVLCYAVLCYAMLCWARCAAAA